MIDKEKVVKGLECCVNDKPFYHAHCGECPYNGLIFNNLGGCTKLYRDALVLLKEQEPVMWSYDGYDCFVCSNCGLRIKDEAVYYLMDKPISFCPACGRKVEWDE